MLIIHSNHKGVTNFNNAKSIFLLEHQIRARMIDDKIAVLAEYETPERAQDVFGEILNEMTHRRVDVVSMPEK